MKNCKFHRLFRSLESIHHHPLPVSYSPLLSPILIPAITLTSIGIGRCLDEWWERLSRTAYTSTLISSLTVIFSSILIFSLTFILSTIVIFLLTFILSTIVIPSPLDSKFSRWDKRDSGHGKVCPTGLLIQQKVDRKKEYFLQFKM